MARKTYRLEVKRDARKELLDLPPKINRQVQETIDRLLNTLNQGRRPQDVASLKGRDRSYRIDSGEYRVLFELNDDEAFVVVFRVRHRRDAYRGL